MPRIRTIKPEMFGDEKLAPMPVVDRFVFVGLIAMADDAGRIVDSVKSIDGFIFPETDDTARESLVRLAAAGRLLRYQSASGQKLIQIAKWEAHQKVGHPSPYVLPAPPNGVASTVSCDSHATLMQGSGSDLRPTTSTNDLRSTTNDPTAGDVRGADAPIAPGLALVRPDARPEPRPETPPSGEPADATSDHAPSEPPRGAPGVTLTTAKPRRMTGRPTSGRTRADVVEHIKSVFAELSTNTDRRLAADELREFQAETVWAYWQTTCNKGRALLDEDRHRLLVKRLRENGGDVSELFYAIDGGRTDPYVRDQRGCDLAFMLGKRSRVEEFANKRRGYANDEPHPDAARLAALLAGDPEAEEVSVSA